MRILIADDHGIVRGGLKMLIERQPDMEGQGDTLPRPHRTPNLRSR